MFLKYIPTGSLIKQAKFIEENDNFYLFGADGEGLFCEEWLRKKEKTVKGFIDNSLDKIGTHLNGYTIFNIDDLLECEVKIIITSIHCDQIALQLNNMGLKLGVDYITYDNIYWIDEPQFYDCIGEPFFKKLNEFENEFIKTYEILDDNYSKEIFTNIINYRLSCLDPIVRGKENLPISFEMHKERSVVRKKRMEMFELEHLPKKIKDIIEIHYICEPYNHLKLKGFSKYHCILDVGGFIGDSAASFALKNPYSKIYSFEPSMEGQKQIKDLSQIFNKIELVPYAAWDTNTTLEFNENEESLQGSRIGEGNNKISAVTIDTYCTDNNIYKVDFIKMDIEGAELNALKGAIEIIERDKPDLAISIYHSPEHLWKIPQWIKKNFPDYNVYIDHTEGLFVWGTICFATVNR